MRLGKEVGREERARSGWSTAGEQQQQQPTPTLQVPHAARVRLSPALSEGNSPKRTVNTACQSLPRRLIDQVDFHRALEDILLPMMARGRGLFELHGDKPRSPGLVPDLHALFTHRRHRRSRGQGHRAARHKRDASCRSQRLPFVRRKKERFAGM